MTDKSISEILAEMGVTHESDGDGRAHKLFFVGRFIGWYDAHAVGALIREHLPEEA